MNCDISKAIKAGKKNWSKDQFQIVENEMALYDNKAYRLLNNIIKTCQQESTAHEKYKRKKFSASSVIGASIITMQRIIIIKITSA